MGISEEDVNKKYKKRRKTILTQGNKERKIIKEKRRKQRDLKAWENALERISTRDQGKEETDSNLNQIDLETIRSCYIRRNGIAKIFREPYLHQYVKGKFVKISTGVDINGNQNYILAEIEGFYYFKLL